ncbi:hypothetical protein RUM44_008989 [Polyplax serrata]|uniref:DUF4746 domain-containing protein n=1 Tax=Polyplax serrata TaxID=468196 RepID=A0ABR1ARG7_POLSC
MPGKTTEKADQGKMGKRQAASLARKMAGKKGQTTQLQVEVNTEEDWEKLLAREGLIVIDVYSEWSGPCVGMTGNLKKAKVDFGGETLHLAIAKSDEIEALARFRNKSEPTWLFVAGGQLITLIFGANAPKLMKTIEAEVKLEIKVLKGETWRRGGPIEELSEEERDRLEAAEKLRSEAERIEIERLQREKEEKRQKVYTYMSDSLLYETVVICFPHTIHPELGCVIMTELELFCRAQMVYVATQAKMNITREMFDEIFYRGGLEPTDDLMEDLALGPCLVLLLKSQIIVAPGQEGEKHHGDMEAQICEALYSVKLTGEEESVIPSPQSIPGRNPYIRRTKIERDEISIEEAESMEDLFQEDITAVPGCWTPSTYLTKCAAIRYLFPARAEKVMQPEVPPIPPKVLIAFDIAKQKECFELVEEYKDDVINAGYFTGIDPATAEHLCATPEQYAQLDHYDFYKVIFVVKKTKSDALLSFAGLGAVYVSPDEKIGLKDADAFFPPGVEPRFRRLEAIELLKQKEASKEVEETPPQPVEEEEPEEPAEQDENDLMASLGLNPEG